MGRSMLACCDAFSQGGQGEGTYGQHGHGSYGQEHPMSEHCVVLSGLLLRTCSL